MIRPKVIYLLIALMVPAILIATLSGMLTQQGGEPFSYTTIRGESVLIYGKGIYRHMGADVAIQGIAQDYITLLIALPLLLTGLYRAHKGKLDGLLLLPGTLLYISLTYLFYTAMAMYNEMFLVYVLLLGLSLFSLIISLIHVPYARLHGMLAHDGTIRWASWFLLITAGSITCL
ncbi:MAG TPA: hypothetical protein VK907_03345, partial [Phnomibacter sp.]|nr:hypothetical protein [Phnomibacter sp.]